MPPPTHCGERIDPCRARPRPFWRHGLRPPPRTSARVLVEWVPRRRPANWAVTTWCMTCTFGSMPNSSASRVTSPFSAPSRLNNGALISGTRLHRPSYDHDRALGSRHGATECEQAPLGVDLDHLEIEDRGAIAAHATGHLHAFEHPGRGGTG